jgi:hypothetical protein
MSIEAIPSSRNPALVPGAFLLAFALVATLWATTYFRAEARVRRATVRVVALAERPGEESPVALGLTANRLGKFLAPGALLELEGYGALATGRQEIVSLFAQIRSAMDVVAFTSPVLVVDAAEQGVIRVRVDARYRLVPEGGAAAEGKGKAELVWIKGEEGWQIARATLQPEEGAQLPQGWK